MADIGVLPTKNSIRITSSSGEHGTIPGATRSAAGVMTADQAGRLDDLWARCEGDGGGGAITIFPPAPLVSPRPAIALSVDAVTRPEMRQALGQIKNEVLGDVGRVLQQVRQDMPKGNVESLDHARIERLELAVIAVGQRMDAVEIVLGEIGAAIQEAASVARRESAA